MRTVAKFSCGVVLLFLCFASCARAQSLFFQPPTDAGVGMTVTADFNGDGIPDLASADGSVQLGKGDGTFKTVTPWTNALGFSGVSFFAVGDFNGDGKQDLLIPRDPAHRQP
jgi:FG-GAP-like repeat